MHAGITALDGTTAVVTGATRGVGRGIAHELARCGARVYVTGRSAPAEGSREGQLTTLRCDHRKDEEVDAVFGVILREVETIDILVNGVWGGYEQMVEAGAFTWSKPFWQQPLWRWDAMFAAGVALATDPDILRHSGRVRVVADLAREYGFTDVDGTTPRALTLADV